MATVTRQSLADAGHKNPDLTFVAIAKAGGFGDVDPSHGGGLDVDGLVDPQAKAAIAELLKVTPAAPKEPAK